MNRIALFTVFLVSASAAFEVPEWASPASPPELEPLYAVVIVDALNLRDAPNLEGDKIGTLHRGDRVELLAWAVDYDPSGDYVWAEVQSDQGRGYLTARREYYYDRERGEGVPPEPYLAFEHDFGSYELETEADLDGDGTLERVYVGPGEVHVEHEDFHVVIEEKEYVYYVPLVLRVEGSFGAEVRLNDFFLGVNTEKIPVEELIAREKESGELGWYYNWSLYGLEAGDFDGDGAVELQLTLDARSTYPRPINGPPFTHRRVLGFIRGGDGLRCVYDYTEEAFIPEWEEEPTGRWLYVSGGAELSPEALRYNAVMCYLEEPNCAIEVHEWLGPLDWVRHPLPPPNYLARGTWYSTELEARWISEAGFYALYCPPGNDYARPLGFYSPAHPARLLYGYGDEYEHGFYGDLLEPLTLYCLPEAGSIEAGVLEAGTHVRVRTFSTGEGDWYLVYPGEWDVLDEEAPPLMGWSRVRPPLEE